MTDITEGRRLAGASVLPYSCDPSHNNIYFLLGAERKLPRWNDSNKWSDFGGAPKRKKGDLENEAECAGREFHEETLGAVKWHKDENPKTVNFVRQNSLPIIKDLEAGNFHFKMVTLIDDDRYYTTYVKQVPFDASVQRRTNNLLSSLGRIRMDVKNSGFHDMNSYEQVSVKNHPSVRLNAEDQCIGVSKDYLEKQSLQWLSIPQIQESLDEDTNGRKNNYILRDSFKGRVQNILDQFESVRLDTEKISTNTIEITKYLPNNGEAEFNKFTKPELASFGKNEGPEPFKDSTIFRYVTQETSGQTQQMSSIGKS